MRPASVIMYKEEGITIIMLSKWWICILSNQYTIQFNLWGKQEVVALF